MAIQVAKDSPPPCNEEAAEKVLKYVRHYEALFGLEKWRIYIYWKLESEFEDPEEWAAETKVDPEYYKARIFFNLDRPQLDKLEEDVRHEMLHCITWQFVGIIESLTYARAKKAVEKLEEKFVSDLELLPLWDKVKLGE
jgi:hypothetical protein